jgi:hypothetical protein
VLSILFGGPADPPVRPTIVVPKIDRPPILDDFLDMKPGPAVEGKMIKLEGFTQRLPYDGQPVSQHTEAYLAYDDQHFYAVFLAFDSNPELIRARMTPRENFRGDDKVDLFLDSFHDERRGYVFTCNALGVQMDGRWTESRSGGNFDSSFNALWHSEARITDQGYIIWMSIPFKSLRFPSLEEQDWGLVLIRWIPRNNESSTWPWATTKIDGRLNQGATMLGIKGIAPGRSIQLIPYGFLRSFRALDDRDPDNVTFVEKNFEPDAGLDAKFVIKNKFALDVAVNPDFSQVESDQPQVTVNQRFEVFFPERRPFFLENADFFETPINLFFSRRIADPQFGVRLTGKQGPYAIGALVADDQSPGKAVLPDDPLSGTRAGFGVIRVNRDIAREANVGILFTDREYESGHNRVGGIDTRFKLNPNWVTTLQAAASSTRSLENETYNGSAYLAELRREGRQYTQRTEYLDISPGFRTESGFVRRTNIRSVTQEVDYKFRPEGKSLVAWGPSVEALGIWDHDGTRLDWEVESEFSFEFTGPTSFGYQFTPGKERLRPEDFNGLEENLDFSKRRQGLFFSSQYFAPVNVSTRYFWGREINLVPPVGQLPVLANANAAEFELTLRPNRHLRNDNTYILSRLTTMENGENIFNNHIFRSKWNWQFNREFALRIILQYDTILSNSTQTRLETEKNFNVDFLFTYLMNPWSALYVGYNSNFSNIDLMPFGTGNRIVRVDDFLHDSRQFFVKFSYLFGF